MSPAKSIVIIIHMAQVKIPTHFNCFINDQKKKKKVVLGLGVMRLMALFAANISTLHQLVCKSNF